MWCLWTSLKVDKRVGPPWRRRTVCVTYRAPATNAFDIRRTADNWKPSGTRCWWNKLEDPGPNDFGLLNVSRDGRYYYSTRVWEERQII